MQVVLVLVQLFPLCLESLFGAQGGFIVGPVGKGQFAQNLVQLPGACLRLRGLFFQDCALFGLFFAQVVECLLGGVISGLGGGLLVQQGCVAALPFSFLRQGGLFAGPFQPLR